MKASNIHFDINEIPNFEFSQEKRKKVNSIVKGKNFERFIANDLSKRFSDRFIRVPCSGGIVGGKFNFIKNYYLSEEIKEFLSGDIICPKWFPFVLELKNYKDEPKLQNLLIYNQNSQLDKWIEQSEKESIQSKKPWLLILKITNYRKNIFCVLKEKLLTNKPSLKDTFFIKYKDYLIIDYFTFWDKLFKDNFSCI